MMEDKRDLTKEEYERLDKYKKMFFDVIRLHCKRALRPSELKELLEVYKALGYQDINTNCAYCVFSMCEVLAKRFFKYQEQSIKKEITGLNKRGRKSKSERLENEQRNK